MTMSNLIKHLKTVHNHRKYVRQTCFKMGLIWQGLTHDLSKYSLTELRIAKYYSGKRSPHAECRDMTGYSPSWMHHYHKNKHHWQFWLDMEDWPDKVIPVKMPYKYVVEMFCDFVGAGKAYTPKGEWTQDMPWNYYEKACKGTRLMHPESEYLFVKLLWNMKEMGPEVFFTWYNSTKRYLKQMYENSTLMFELYEEGLY